ncbi:MAG: phosphoglucosamine mutase [Desulfatibacillum sp.]|nr:phosphoglucosamine mutase [Desulfatibacillum sp.]
MEKLFGTDGVRGKANQYPITPEMAVKIGRAVAQYFGKHSTLGQQVRIGIGRDTRISGAMLESAAAAGICSAGADALFAGIIPTPGLAHIIRESSLDAGIMISASHNPFEDNGLKVFGGRGYKLSDEVEQEIEALVFQEPASGGPVGETLTLSDAEDSYAAFLQALLPGNAPLKGLRLVMDASNGATYSVAPRVFENLGAEVFPLFVSPDGVNINVDCGSQHPEVLQKEVLRHKANLGLAFDGDGDRLIAVDEAGNRISGDQILIICAAWLKETGRLAKNTVVSTVMSNLGFKQALNRMDILHIAANVGDRYVLEAMQRSGSVIGGEDSGHMIFLEHHTTGDGVLSGIQLIGAMLHFQKPLSELGRMMEVFPQVLINIPVTAKPDLSTIAPVALAIDAAEKELGDLGRILVRYSGTRPVCRVMVEGPTREITEDTAQAIARVVEQELGG